MWIPLLSNSYILYFRDIPQKQPNHLSKKKKSQPRTCNYKKIWVKERIRCCRFLLIFTYTDVWLVSAPAGLESYPRGVRAPCRGQKKEKSYCENTKKPATSFSSFDSKTLIRLEIILLYGAIHDFIKKPFYFKTKKRHQQCNFSIGFKGKTQAKFRAIASLFLNISIVQRHVHNKTACKSKIFELSYLSFENDLFSSLLQGQQGEQQFFLQTKKIPKKYSEF